MIRPSYFAWVVCVAGLLGIAAMVILQTPRQPVETNDVAGADIGGTFTLTDDRGQTVTEKSWAGQYRLMYFGFTHCPDVCPLGLNKMTEALNAAPSDVVAKIQPIFVTVDPERDTVADMHNYVGAFHKKLVGLTGSVAQIDAVKKAFRVYAAKQGAGADYMVDHSAFMYLFDPNGHLLAIFAHDATADDIATKIKAVVR